MYDSTEETKKHIENVCLFLSQIIGHLACRGAMHDESKLKGIEKEIFDIWTPKLKGITYGTAEYKKMMEKMMPAIRHHYKKNRHHPEYFGKDGLHGMDLIDVIEMLCDWKAATLRHDDGDIKKSLKINKKRFDIPPLLFDIFKNTIINMNW